ncbi:transposase [Streptomyces sp. 110]|uniref:Transposase n=1 Tax=Streptomyces endocoffeicus TaxID=2898945 RepID=A0ABS1Q3Q1_9ACTN|nr:transposase [Streptomyces endocoffeicus]
MVLDVVASELEALVGRVAGRFGRAEPRRRVREYVSGLVAGLPRSNGWTLAEQAGDVSPDGMQRLPRRADRDIADVRDDVRAHMVERLGDPGGVPIVDVTGFLKKGNRSAGVQRQYSGTAGRVENCQIGTFLAYRSARGHALSDRELYLPKPTEVVDRRPRPVPGSGNRRRRRVRDQTPADPGDDRTRPRRGGAVPVGDRGRGLRAGHIPASPARDPGPVPRTGHPPRRRHHHDRRRGSII